MVCRGEAPFEGMWAIPGGFKRPTETLDAAARRELHEETGVDAASLLTQFGAYGDPERDPRMNVVTVAYLAVLRDVKGVAGGSDAAAAALLPVADLLSGKIELAFDHLRILRDAIPPRPRCCVESSLRRAGRPRRPRTPTAARPSVKVGPTKAVAMPVISSSTRWVVPTGRRVKPGAAGDRPAELYRPGKAWQHGGPIHRTHRGERKR